MKLNNEFMKLVIETGDERFLVEAVCTTQGAANIYCNLNPTWGVIAEVENPKLIFLANVRPCRSVKVHFADGNTITTSINGTVADIKKYYVGGWFNIGEPGKDNNQKAVRVEFLDTKMV